MNAPPGALVAPPYFALRISAFFAGFFFINGIAMPWFPVWLQVRGLSDIEIGSVLAVTMIVRVLFTPLGGYVADRAPSRRFAIRLFIIPSGLFFLLAWPAEGYWALLLFTGAAFTLWSLALPGGEALALTASRRFGLDYSRMRLWGSVTFILANVGSGALLGFFPKEAIFWFILFGFAVAATGSLALPLTPRAVRSLDDASRPAKEAAAWRILSQPGLLAPMVAGGLIQASHAVFYSFGSIYWQKLGFTPPEIGGFWAISLIGEILFFAFAGRLVRRVSPYLLIVIGAIGAMVRWGFFGFDIGAPGFAALQSLHMLSFAATFLGNQFAVLRAVPENLAASAQGVIMLIGGLLMAAATFAAGPLYETFQADAFPIMAALPVAGLLVLSLRHFIREPAQI